LAAGVKHITSCYLHEGRPAVRDCLKCGRPICSQCSQEGDNTALCISCAEKQAAKGRRKEKTPRRPRRKGAVEPGVPVAKGTAAPVGAPDLKAAPPPPPTDGAAGTSSADSGWQTVAPPVQAGVPGAPAQRPAPARGPLPAPSRTARAEGFPSPVDTGKTGMRKEEHIERTRSRVAERQRITSEPNKVAGAVTDKLRAWAVAMFPAGGKARQMIFALPYALIAGVGVLAFWLMLAYVSHQWSQYSILVAGVAISWALFKGTTLKKKDGVRVYENPPSSFLMAVTSIVILAVLTPIVEMIAYAIIYSGSNAFRDPLSHFGNTYFRAFDDVKIFFGFALAFVLPFFLNAGQDWKVPSWLKWAIPGGDKKEKKEETKEEAGTG